jgi:hypothetical protein
LRSALQVGVVIETAVGQEREIAVWHNHQLLRVAQAVLAARAREQTEGLLPLIQTLPDGSGGSVESTPSGHVYIGEPW